MKMTLCKAALIVACGVSAYAVPSGAQTTRPAGTKDYSDSPIVTRMMRFDVKKDGKLTRDEVLDLRLLRVFDAADANKDGIVTRDELIAVAAKLETEVADGPGGRPGGPGGPGMGPGGLGGRRFGGPGPGGFGGPPAPGQVLPPRVEQMLGLTDAQKSEVAKLQKEVDDRLAQILTDDQKQQMKQLALRGPGRRGGPGGGPGGEGPGGPGGPGGDEPPPEN
jgi:hypothetical protein